MRMLLIETSTERGLVAITENTQVLFQEELPFGYNNSKTLLPTIDKGLKSLNLFIKQFDCISVGIGPGSYTGIRIGVTVAKSLAYAAGLPLIGFSSLKAFIPQENGSFCAIFDAKISGAYMITGVQEERQIHYHSEPMVCPLNKIMEHTQGVVWFVTPQKIRLALQLTEIVAQPTWQWLERAPSAEQIALLTLEKFHNEDCSNDGHLELLYLRKTQAEIEAEKKKSEAAYSF
jgi:tRNA threonylcarbamoyl adenosine modification protein YeaZ